MDAVFRARLSELIGARAINVERGRVTPVSSEQLALVCRLCSETSTALTPVSGPVDPAATEEGPLTVSLARLSGIAVTPAQMVVRAEAGATLSAVEEAVTAAGMTMAAVPVMSAARHVGSLVSRGELPRRALTGIEAVLVTGERVHAGGAVLKDVAGYDLINVLLGSCGRLAVITAVTMRLQPTGSRPVSHPWLGRLAVGSELTEAFDPAGLLRPQPDR